MSVGQGTFVSLYGDNKSLFLVKAKCYLHIVRSWNQICNNKKVTPILHNDQKIELVTLKHDENNNNNKKKNDHCYYRC